MLIILFDLQLFGNIRGLFSELCCNLFWNIRGTCLELLGNLFGTFGELFWNMFRTVGDLFWNALFVFVVLLELV